MTRSRNGFNDAEAQSFDLIPMGTIALRPIFSNVADQIRIGELIAAGNLVRPRTFVIDVGAQSALAKVKRQPTTSTWRRSARS